MCGCDDDEELLPCCGRGHYLHPSCMTAIAATCLLCPLCRGAELDLALRTVALDPSCLAGREVMALAIGMIEHASL